ncbi:hypothetical protein VTN02DRAFT_6064 [Thermoascus thermophilus]
MPLQAPFQPARTFHHGLLDLGSTRTFQIRHGRHDAFNPTSTSSRLCVTTDSLELPVFPSCSRDCTEAGRCREPL